ncbi:MAG: dephospho-CoA kinase [Coriobacteriia bacterium]|nr:dephospho-CoA kinase [Coriobacteriia bacterium]
MRVVVITGGIGAGKSTASGFLRDKGAIIIDADLVAAQVLQKGSPVLAHVAEAFGPDVLLADGSLDRAALARLAFATAESTARLNAIVHPAVAREIGPAVADLRLMPAPPCAVVLEVPLLAEAPVFAQIADLVVAIVAPQELRVQRAIASGFSEADVRRRLAVQASDAERAALADVVIVNDGSLERFLGELEWVWHERVAEGEER